MQSDDLIVNSEPDGIHYLYELFGCDFEQINNKDFLQNTLLGAIKVSAVSALHDHFYTFTPQGITGFILLSASHISIHTWPEYNYVAFDVFSCDTQQSAREIAEKIRKAIKHEKANTQSIKRGYSVEYDR